MTIQSSSPRTSLASLAGSVRRSLAKVGSEWFEAVNRVLGLLPKAADRGLTKVVETAMLRCLKTAIRTLGLEKTARIIHGDIFKQDYSSADLLTVYLLPVSNDKVRPLLEKQLKKGTRIVSHDFPFREWTPVKEVSIEDDGEGRSHTLYLYRR